MGKAPPRLDVLLSARSYFSFGMGVRSPTSLLSRAAELGFSGLGLSDISVIAGAVELSEAARERGMKALIGASVPVIFGGNVYPIQLIAASRGGYRNLNELLTKLQEGKRPALELTDLADFKDDLFCLTGGRDGFLTALFASKCLPEALGHLGMLRTLFKGRLFVQVFHDRAPNDTRRRDFLRALARDQGLPLVAAPDVRMTETRDFPLLDALTCARLGIDVTTPHPERPRNDAAVMLSPEGYGRLLPFPDALSNASRIAKECELDLLPERLTSPGCKLPPGLSAQQHLEQLAYAALMARYPAEDWKRAEARLDHELNIVRDLELASFFLTAHEVVEFCEGQGILASGRGSAAASVLCYLLGVTKIDPLKHDLLFERFLFSGKSSMPDVDFDISSSRRREVIAWVEERWGGACEAMVANRITYRLPSAVQDLGRALGLPPAQRDRLSKALGRDYRNVRPHRAKEAEVVFDEVLGSAPVKFVLLDLLERMEPGFVRQLAPHSGGVVLSSEALTHYSPTDRSSGGIKLLSFDKDDVEKLGLIKLDLLGLRMLAALERAREDVLRLTGEWLDYAELPDDPQVWEEIRDGDTMGLFQIESPGQARLSTQLKPGNMTQLAHQVALFRPGPIQSQTVHPYVRRARGLEPVPVLPEPLNAILLPTHGVILFQEQILHILVKVCGLDWGPAEKLRKAIANCEEVEEEARLREGFVTAARAHSGWAEPEALSCFQSCFAFKGYGFAESHAWAFAQHTYASAWTRRHHPAAYWAAVLSEAPGMWPAHTLANEAGRFGVELLPLDINRSGVQHRAESRGAIRLPFVAVDGVSEDVARDIVLERHSRGPYVDLDDFHGRLAMNRDVIEKLVLAGAFDVVMDRREALYRLGVLANAAPSGKLPLLSPIQDVPTLGALSESELLAFDFETKALNESGKHPMDLWRSELRTQGVVPLSVIRTGQRVVTAGLVVARQRPPTAKGTAFFVIEDRTYRAQIVISPELWDAHRQLLRDASALIVEGLVFGEGRVRAIRAERLWTLPLERIRGYDYA